MFSFAKERAALARGPRLTSHLVSGKHLDTGNSTGIQAQLGNNMSKKGNFWEVHLQERHLLPGYKIPLSGSFWYHFDTTHLIRGIVVGEPDKYYQAHKTA